MADIHGSWDPRFDAVAVALAGSLDAGTDLGASVAVLVHGEPVVDIWGGSVDEAGTAPWQEDTLVSLWSMTKTLTFLAALVLADRGDLDLGAPVARYWPEFAAAGKGAVEVRHLLAHTAGLPGWDEPLAAEDLADWERCTGLLARQAPWWEPGTASGYHILTQGYLVGEVVRRVTGVSFGTWFAAEVAGPLGADLFVGLPGSEDHRVAAMVPPPPGDLAGVTVTDLAVRAGVNPLLDPDWPSREWWRRSEIPAANGHGNARSMALVQSVLAGRGESRGVRLLSKEGCDQAFVEQIRGTDLVLGTEVTFGMGYGLRPTTMPLGPRGCYWGGFGGSQVAVDQDAGLSVCYAMNRMENGLLGDERGYRIVAAAVAALAGA